MFADTIKKIERQYEIKRNQADALFISEKKAVYDSTPKLAEIDREITKRGIQTAKLSLNMDSQEREESIKKLQCEILNLKNEKEKILSSLNINLVPKYSCHKCNDTRIYIKKWTK